MTWDPHQMSEATDNERLGDLAAAPGQQTHRGATNLSDLCWPPIKKGNA